MSTAPYLPLSAGRVAGKIAIVSGAASGIGAEQARILAQEGAHVIVGDIDVTHGQALAAEIGDNAMFCRLDVTRPEDWSAAVEVANRRWGVVDVLVNNAGIGASAEFDDESLDSFRKVIEVNLFGVFNGMKAVSPAMKRLGHGSIINMSSQAGLNGWWHGHGYTASKFAIRGLTKSAALDLGPYNVRVNSVHPGIIDTPMTGGQTFLTEQVPLKRAASPVEIARLTLFLASDESSFSTGAEFLADGGQTAGFPGPAFVGQAPFKKIDFDAVGGNN
ncbi:TPA: SDR family oxidoreductase [Pseudomonas aeruginosa]|nr:SDR family oxidoreductase [Pseudomonas aeruginosa]